MNDDAALLEHYARSGAEDAFSELVSRHLALVYHAALRQVAGDTRRAEDVAQAVFIDLARKAAHLSRRPCLVGWLHTSTRFAATNLRRAEHRRQIREREALAMHEIQSASPIDTAWERLRPVIDDALHDLGERDREAVLLRYFEGLTFAAVGAKLSVTEDAARVRVERALEKIRRALAHRGVTSTSAALATVLGGHAAAAAPDGLASQIAAGTFAAGAGVGAGAAGLGLLTLMSTTKTAAVTGALFLLAAGIAIQQGLENRQSRASLAATQNEHAALLSKISELERQLTASAARARATEDEGATLLATLDAAAKAGAVSPTGSTASTAPITRAMVDARFKRARELAKNGHAKEALEEYLWCYDEGMLRIPYYFGVRQSYVLGEIAEIGKTYPPALDALRERRDKAELAMLGGDDHEAASIFASINNALDENARTLRFWDQLPADDIRRSALGSEIYDELAQAKRYQEAIQAMPWHTMSILFHTMSDRQADMASDKTPNAEKRRQEEKARLVKQTAGHIEVLAGAGDLDHARELAVRLLTFDDSPETQALVKEGLSRVGRLTLLDAGAKQ